MADAEQHENTENTNEKEKNTNESEKDGQQNISLNANEEKENKEEKNVKLKNEDQNTEANEEKGEKNETKGRIIEVQTVKSHYKTFSNTTLPHVLTEYGLEDKTQPKKKKKEKEKPKKKKRHELLYNEEDDLRQQRKARDEKFRQTYGDNRSVNQHYADYLEFIEKKVINQRQKLQKEREEEEKREKEKEDEERQKLKFKRSKESVMLKHDAEFLQGLPKTDLFRIVALQDRLKKQGKLKTQSDVDKFWEEITQPDVFYAQFKVNRSTEPTKQPPKTEDLPQIHQKPRSAVISADIPPRSLSHISESSRGEQPWAITQQFQSSHGIREKSAKSGKSTPSSKDPLLDLERRCPKLEMPPLASFSLKLSEKPTDPEAIQRETELRAREKNRKKFVRKLRKMHQMAMANAAIANRLLAQRGDLTQILEGTTLRDLRNYCCEPHFDEDIAVYDEPESAVRYPSEMTRAIEIYPEEAESQPSTTSSRPSSHKSSGSHRLTPLGSESSSTAGSGKSRKKQLSAEMIEYPTPLPLTYSEVAGSAKIMEAKCLSTYWTNYMHAGKSVFAPS